MHPERTGCFCGVCDSRICFLLLSFFGGAFVMSFRQKLYGFLQGRNGPDALSHAMAFMCVALVIVNFFVASVVIYCIELALMLLWIFRMFSRVIEKKIKNLPYLIKLLSRLTRICFGKMYRHAQQSALRDDIFL